MSYLTCERGRTSQRGSRLHLRAFRSRQVGWTLAAAFLLVLPFHFQGQTFNTSTWMKDLQPYIGNVPIKGIAIPGTHDSSTYLVPSDLDYNKNQRVDYLGQLNAGARWLDMRVDLEDAKGLQGCTQLPGALPASATDYYMYGHNNKCSGIPLSFALDEVSHFLDHNPNEIVILYLTGTVQVGPPTGQTSNVFESYLDQHLRRASDGTSYIYDLKTACGIAEGDYLSTSNYSGLCTPLPQFNYGANQPPILPQEVTPNQLYRTSARVILIEDYGLTGQVPGFDLPTLTWKGSSTQRKRGYYEANPGLAGASDPDLEKYWLEFQTPDRNLGLYALRPQGANYDTDNQLLTLQTNLEEFGATAGNAAYALDPPITLAHYFNPDLISEIQSSWLPHNANIVEVDDISCCGIANAIIYSNATPVSSTFGRVPSGSNGASQISVGHDGSVYKLAFSGGSGSGRIGQLYRLSKLTGTSGTNGDWTDLGLQANRIAADPNGGIYMLDDNGNLSHRNASGTVASGLSPLLLNDVAVDGSNGTVYVVTLGIASTLSNGNLNNTLPGLTGVTHIAANSGVVAAVDSNGELYEYGGNGRWTSLSAPFTATSLAVDDSGFVWATQTPQVFPYNGMYGGGFNPAPASVLWHREGSTWVMQRSGGVQVATGYSFTNVDVTYVSDSKGNIYNVRFGARPPGNQGQAPPPKRYAPQVTASGLTYNHATQLFSETLIVTNATGSDITDQLAVLFEGLPAGVTIANNSTTYQGQPFVLMPPGTLAAGASVSARVQFTDPNMSHITYSNIVYAYVPGN